MIKFIKLDKKIILELTFDFYPLVIITRKQFLIN